MSVFRKEQAWLITISLVILAAVAIGNTLIFARAILIPFVLALFIAQIVSPILDFQVIKLKFSRPIAIVLTLLIVTIILIVLSLLFVQAIYSIVSTAGRYSEYFLKFASEMLIKLEEAGVIHEKETIIQDMQKQIPKVATSTFGNVVGFLSSFMLVSIFVIFLLIGRSPHVVQEGIFAEIDQRVRKYLVIKVIVSIATGVFVWIFLAAFGLELAGVFGILAFLLNFIPSIGSIIASLLPIPIAVAQFTNPWYIAVVIACPALVELIIGNVIEPRFMGKGLNLHPVTIILSLSFWGLIWGIPGMFLAVPITAVLRIVLMQFETLRPLGMLLAGRLELNFDNNN